MAETHSDGLSSVGASAALSPRSCRHDSSSSRTRSRTSLTLHNGSTGAGLGWSWVVTLTSPCQTWRVGVSWAPETLHFDWLLCLTAKTGGKKEKRNRNVPFIRRYQSRDGCYQAAAVENMVAGVDSRPVGTGTASREVRLLSLDGCRRTEAST